MAETVVTTKTLRHAKLQSDEWMNEWMNDWTNEWMDAWNEWMNGMNVFKVTLSQLITVAEQKLQVASVSC